MSRGKFFNEEDAAEEENAAKKSTLDKLNQATAGWLGSRGGMLGLIGLADKARPDLMEELIKLQSSKNAIESQQAELDRAMGAIEANGRAAANQEGGDLVELSRKAMERAMMEAKVAAAAEEYRNSVNAKRIEEAMIQQQAAARLSGMANETQDEITAKMIRNAMGYSGNSTASKSKPEPKPEIEILKKPVRRIRVA